MRLQFVSLVLLLELVTCGSRTLTASARQNEKSASQDGGKTKGSDPMRNKDGEGGQLVRAFLGIVSNLERDTSTSDPEVKLPRPAAKPTPSRKRPVLKANSFGYRHALHLNQKHSNHQLSNLFERQKQNFDPEGLPVAKTKAKARSQCEAMADLHCEKHQKYRKADGTCNNLHRPALGQSGMPFKRLLPRKHSLVACGGAALSRLPNARVASRLLTKRSEADVTNDLTMYVMVWGQMIDHDMMLTPLRETEDGEFLDCCDPENIDAQDCCPIQVPRGDFFYAQRERPDCIPFLRSKLTSFPGNCRNRMMPDIENKNTPWIDQSFLYGSSQEREEELIAKEGSGKLLVSADKAQRVFPPINVDDGFKMEFGDSRGDVHPAFTLLHTAFLRHHNRLATRLAELHPGWSSDKLYRETRKINNAIYQHITYTQFLDALLGRPNDVRTNDAQLHHDYYKAGIDARISTIFSTAAFRLHTYVAGRFQLRDHNYRPTSSMLLRDVFHDPLKLLANNTYDELIRGLASQSLHEFNNIYTPEMTEWLFADKDKDFGMDIISLNIQRGRDHQIHGYPAYRELCGLGTVNDWQDLEDFISHENAHRLAHTYRRPSDVDMYIGANMEVPVKGSMIGPTMHCYVREQFESLRDGDRFFYTRPTEFTRAQLKAIKSFSLSNLLCANADNPRVMRLPANVFAKVGRNSNPLRPCSTFPELDLSKWV